MDACNHGVVAVLEQQNPEGEWKPCTFFGRKLEFKDGKGKKAWSPREQETYALVSCLLKLISWIGGRKVIVDIDQKSMESWYKEDLCTLSGPFGRRGWWHKNFKPDHIELVYKVGREKTVADGLSRWAYASGLADDTNVATASPTVVEQAPPGHPDASRAAPPTRATVQANSAESRFHPHDDPSDVTSTTDENMTESRGSGTSRTTPPPAVHPSPGPSRPGPDAANMNREPENDASGDNPSPGTLAAQDREIMPPPPPRPPHVGEHLDLEQLRRAYDIYHRTPSCNLVDALRVQFQGVHGDRRFAAALLLHGATNMCVRQLQALLILRQRTPDDLMDVWIWWLNYHQQDRGRVWVPHLAWAHTLIPPPTEPRLAPSPGDRT